MVTHSDDLLSILLLSLIMDSSLTYMTYCNRKNFHGIKVREFPILRLKIKLRWLHTWLKWQDRLNLSVRSEANHVYKDVWMAVDG